jgi:hypothetical protein
MFDRNELLEQFPIKGEGSENMRKISEHKQKIEAKLSIDNRCPVEVWAFNFRPKKGDGKSQNKPCCDLLLLNYKSEKGKFEIGEVFAEAMCHNILESRITDYNPFAAFNQRKRPTKKTVKKRIGKREINEICIVESLPYRPLSIQNSEMGHKKIIFWHPEYGYSSASKHHWVNYKTKTRPDPYRNHKIDRETINKAKLLVFENNLEKIYQILDEPLVYGNHADKRIHVFCKLHGNRTVVSLYSIEKGLWFNCEQCAKKVFWNKNRLRELRQHPTKDNGENIVYLISATVKDKKTLKFGITKVGPSSRTNEQAIKARFNSSGYRDLIILEHHRCSTEKEARELEDMMLLETLEFINNDISENVKGYTECRIYSESAFGYCNKIFYLTLHNYSQNQ